jgi:nucleoid-associated protein EbfC
MTNDEVAGVLMTFPTPAFRHSSFVIRASSSSFPRLMLDIGAGVLFLAHRNLQFMNIQKMMKQAQQMQEKMQRAQEELAEKEVEVTAGGGKISVKANGAGDVLAIKISKDVVDPNDVEMLEDLILTGVQKAIEEGRALMQAEMGKITGGLGLPPGLGF